VQTVFKLIGKLSWLLVLVFFCVPTCGAEDSSSVKTYQKVVRPLIQKHCVQCHGENQPKGNFRIDTLGANLHEGESAGFWHEVLNQVNEGEMPPADQKQLTTEELTTFTSWLEAGLKEAAAKRSSSGGRQMMRRMSRYEYQYTLQDLLGISLDYTAHIPGDFSGQDGLMTNAKHLGMSPILMQGYMNVALMALDEAIPDGPAKVFKETTTKYQRGKIRGQRQIGQMRRQKGKPKPKEPRIQQQVLAPSPGFTLSHFNYDLPAKATFNERPFAGRFAIRARVKAFASSDGRLPELTIQIGHRASGDYDPKKIIGSKMLQASGQEQVVEFIGNIEEFPLGKKDGYYNGSGSHNVTHLSAWIWNTAKPIKTYTRQTPIEEVDEPLLHLVSVEFEGPLLQGYPSQTAKDLLPPKPADVDETTYARKVLATFLGRAFRRKVDFQEVESALAAFHSFRELTGDFKGAIRKAMASRLVSPKFLYLVEPTDDSNKARNLDAFELASRLSYFLWASMPDDELLALAANGSLLEPQVLRQQVVRMCKDPKFSRFARRFSHQWLGLSALENVAVNPKLHPAFSDEIREALKEETVAFAEHVFINDLSALNFIQSEFVMLNSVLASHYGINGVHGAHFRPVNLTPELRRGGLLAQGSVLLMGSDGSESNPIYRGVWLRKRLFADPPPPPPPGAPPLEKQDTSQLSIKQQMALHRENAACARCHNKIDPWGIAFEAFDATGRLKTSPFDAVSILPGGEQVDGLSDLQAYIVEKKSRDFADALVRRIAGYALGRQLEYSDTPLIKQLTDKLISKDFRISSVIEDLVTSSTFLTK